MILELAALAADADEDIWLRLLKLLTLTVTVAVVDGGKVLWLAGDCWSPVAVEVEVADALAGGLLRVKASSCEALDEEFSLVVTGGLAFFSLTANDKDDDKGEFLLD